MTHTASGSATLAAKFLQASPVAGVAPQRCSSAKDEKREAMNIIITGAAGALGSAVIDRFGSAGDRLALIDRREGESREAATWFVVDNLADEAAASSGLAGGGIESGQCRCAGSSYWCILVDSRCRVTALRLARALLGKCRKCDHVCSGSAPHLTDGGSIVLVGAAVAQRAGAGMGPYATAKASVARLAEALSQELAPRRIRTNCILPLIIDTPRNRAEMPDAHPSIWTSTSAIADAISFLAGMQSRGVNGACLEVTNGA